MILRLKVYSTLQMLSQTKNISNEIILSMLAKNNLAAWEHIYDKYAAAMYGLIIKVTGDKNFAEEILANVFLELKEKQNISGPSYSLCAFLLRYSYNFAIHQINNNKVSQQTILHPDEKNIVELLCTKCSSINDAANTFNITTEEAKLKLHEEFLRLRNRKSLKENTIKAA